MSLPNTTLQQAVELLLGSGIRLVRREDAITDLSAVGLPPVLSFSRNRQLMKALNERGYAHFHSFIAIPSRTAPRWVLPIAARSAMLAATDIYQPHKMAPRLIKKMAGGMLRLGREGWLGPRLLIASTGRSPLEILVRELTGERLPLFALSFGRRPAVRKLTVQVMRPNGEILGYIKLPLTDLARERVMQEASVLDGLSRFPALRLHVPGLLHAGEWSDSYMLFQTPLRGEPGPTAISKLHETFLSTLSSAHRVDRDGMSLVEDVATRWGKVVGLLDSKWSALGSEVLRRSAQCLGCRTLPCGIGHGDFAPWNTRFADGRLLVFDWESSRWDAPLSWDLFHFSLQTAASSLKAKQSVRFSEASDDRDIYRLYLLDSVIQFVQEQNTDAVEHRKRLLTGELEKPLDMRSGERQVTVQIIEPRSKTAALGRSIGSCTASRVPSIVTTSWDDGSPRDRRIAELLRSRELPGTFYIPMSGYLGGPTLTRADIQALSDDGFEVGAHSVSHESLTLLRTRREIEHEVVACKHALEQTIGKEVAMFCYPNGRYNSRVMKEVHSAGYKGARTTRMLSITPAFKPFEMPTTLQAYPHPRSGYVRDLGRARNVPGLWRFTTKLGGFQNWIDLGKQLFSQVLENGGVWHLYGHSWEINQLGLWSDLIEMLDYVSHRNGVLYLTNSELVSVVSKQGNYQVA
jgi:peptidoglycan/xylan/chitin deacetylase (PgdA/CDA1 family)